VICRRFEGAAYKAPPPPALPDFRVKENPPFTYTGVDFAVFRRESTSSKVCLFTCCVTRAIHLELVPDLFASTFIH
jgi:hypothetical protein